MTLTSSARNSRSPSGVHWLAPGSPVHPAYPEPLLSLVLALKAQHNYICIHWHYLELVFFLPHLFLLVHNTAAQQVYVQLRAVVFGRFVALEEKGCDFAGVQVCILNRGPWTLKCLPLLLEPGSL